MNRPDAAPLATPPTLPNQGTKMATPRLRLLAAVVMMMGTLGAWSSALTATAPTPAAASGTQGRPILGYGQDEQFTAPGEPWRGGGPPPKAPPGPGYPRQPTLISPAFPDYGALPLKYAPNAARMATFDALTPPLAWTAPPVGTVSVVVTMTDMEASSGGDPQDLLLWAVINIPANTQMLAEGVPRGKTSMLQDGAFQRSFLTNGYIGPQPGANLRPHHYLFELYTLDRMLELPRDVTLDQLKTAIKGHQTGQRGVLVATCCTASK